MNQQQGAQRRRAEAGATMVEYAAVLGFASIVAVLLVAIIGQRTLEFFQDAAALFG